MCYSNNIYGVMFYNKRGKCDINILRYRYYIYKM